MRIDPAVAAVIEECASQSHAGTLRFDKNVARLSEVGVESYHSDYRRGETTYYLSGGAMHAVVLPVPEGAASETFSAEAVRQAVVAAQRDEIRYPEFVRRTRSAGCIGYWVWITGRHVAYHGPRGEAYIEPFPDQPGSVPTAARSSVEVVKQVYEAFRRRDFATALALFAPNATIDQSSELPWGGHYEGHEGVKDFFARLVGRIDSTLALDRFIDAGDHVVALGRTRGVVRGSQSRYDVPVAHVWAVRDGLVTRVQYFIDNPPMLAAIAALEGPGR